MTFDEKLKKAIKIGNTYYFLDKRHFYLKKYVYRGTHVIGIDLACWEGVPNAFELISWMDYCFHQAEIETKSGYSYYFVFEAELFEGEMDNDWEREEIETFSRKELEEEFHDIF